jgi:hypothetical protein
MHERTCACLLMHKSQAYVLDLLQHPMHGRPNIQQQNHHFLRNNYVISKSTGIAKRRNDKPISCFFSEKEVIEMSRKENKGSFVHPICSLRRMCIKTDKAKTDTKEQFHISLQHI